MKKIIFIAFILFVPIIVEAAYTTNLNYGKEETPKKCPGTFGHSAQLFSESVVSGINSFSAGGTITTGMAYAQRRVNEVSNCENITEKQAEKATKNYEKQYEKVEKKVEKINNKEGVSNKIAEQTLYQTKKLKEIAIKKPKIAFATNRMVTKSNQVADNIIQKHAQSKRDEFQKKLNEIKNPKQPAPVTTPTSKDKTDAQIREENDCLPNESVSQCLEEDWDGKYYSAEEYERANGLR